MAGRFEGLSDLEWKLFEDIFPETPKKRARGMPPVPFRYVLNSLLYMLITGCRWCDLPRGNIWASKSSAHRWLKRWQQDGTLEQLQSRILGIAQNKGLINWNYGAVDGSFSPWKRWW
jgi:transposase